MKRDSFVFYRGFYEALCDLAPDERLACFEAICRYALDGEEPQARGVVSAVFKMARPQVDANNRRYENGKKGGRPKQNQTITKAKPNDNQSKTKDKPKETKSDPNVNDNVNVNANDNVIVKRFTAPTTKDVSEYAQEKGYSIDADRFVDFYSSKGWKVGKSPMKDWRAAVRNWARSADKPKTENKFNNFSARKYDFDDLARRLQG